MCLCSLINPLKFYFYTFLSLSKSAEWVSWLSKHSFYYAEAGNCHAKPGNPLDQQLTWPKWNRPTTCLLIFVFNMFLASYSMFRSSWDIHKLAFLHMCHIPDMVWYSTTQRETCYFPIYTFRNHSKMFPSDPVISQFRVHLTEWIHSKILRPELRNSLTMMDQLQRAEEANWQRMSLYCKCHSTASFSPTLNNSWRSECFLQSFTLQNEHNGTGSYISCQVPIQRHVTPSQQYENPLLIMLQLPETTL